MQAWGRCREVRSDADERKLRDLYESYLDRAHPTQGVSGKRTSIA